MHTSYKVRQIVLVPIVYCVKYKNQLYNIQTSIRNTLPSNILDKKDHLVDWQVLSVTTLSSR